MNWLKLFLFSRLPLVQSRQKFTSMDLELRQEFHSKIEKLGEKYNMDRITYASFALQHGFRGRYCASDVVYAMLALLESNVNIFQIILFIIMSISWEIIYIKLWSMRKISNYYFYLSNDMLKLVNILISGKGKTSCWLFHGCFGLFIKVSILKRQIFLN